MAASADGRPSETGDRERRDRALASVLEARVERLKGTAARAEGLLADEGTDGAAALAAIAAQRETARRALDRID